MLAIFVYIANSTKFKLPPNISVLQHNYMVIFCGYCINRWQYINAISVPFNLPLINLDACNEYSDLHQGPSNNTYPQGLSRIIKYPSKAPRLDRLVKDYFFYFSTKTYVV